MPLNIRSDEVNRLAETLAARTRLNKTEAVKQALQNELPKLPAKQPLAVRLHAPPCCHFGTTRGRKSVGSQP
jgi:antitoxin VapB